MTVHPSMLLFWMAGVSQLIKVLAPKTCPFSGLKNGPKKRAKVGYLLVSEEERGGICGSGGSGTPNCVPRKWTHFWVSF
jgi:hypothetical protein